MAPHFRLVDSGVVWPDLGATRITAVTASQGESPEREDSSEADIFEIILDPGATVTYIAELANPRTCRSSICGTPTTTRRRSTA